MLPQYMPFPTSLFHSIPYLSTFIVLTKPVSADQVFLALFALRKWDTFILTWDSNFPCASDIWWIEEGVVRRQDRTSLMYVICMYVYHYAYTRWGIKLSIYLFILSHTEWAASTCLIYLYINDKYLKGQVSEKTNLN